MVGFEVDCGLGYSVRMVREGVFALGDEEEDVESGDEEEAAAPVLPGEEEELLPAFAVALAEAEKHRS